MPINTQSQSFERAVVKATKYAVTDITEYVWLDASAAIAREAKAVVRRMEIEGYFYRMEESLSPDDYKYFKELVVQETVATFSDRIYKNCQR